MKALTVFVERVCVCVSKWDFCKARVSATLKDSENTKWGHDANICAASQAALESFSISSGDGRRPPKDLQCAERDAVIVSNNVCRGLGTDELISPRNVFAKGRKGSFS